MVSQAVTERRVRRMLELQRKSRDLGALFRERATRRVLTLPKRPEASAALARSADETHAAFVGRGPEGEALVETSLADAYYNFRVVVGHHGPPCAASWVHRVADRCVRGAGRRRGRRGALAEARVSMRAAWPRRRTWPCWARRWRWRGGAWWT